MKKKCWRFWEVFMVFEAVVCLLAAIVSCADGSGIVGSSIMKESLVGEHMGSAIGGEASVLALLTFPYVPAARGLRSLSLAGTWGNVLAIVIYAAIGVLPLLYGVFRLRKGRSGAEDLLLPLLSALLFWGNYLLINPAYIDRLMGRAGMTDAGRTAVCSAVDAVIICYVILRLVRYAHQSRTGRLLNLIQMVMGIASAVLIYAVFGSGFAGFLELVRRISSGNQPVGTEFSVTVGFLFFRYLLSCIPAAADLGLIALGNRLAESMKEDRYSMAAVTAAGKLAKFGRASVIVIAFTYMVQNLVQLPFSSMLLVSSYEVNLPLGSVALALVMMLLARYIAETRELKEDNAMII